jgi:hypothetical protein
MKETLITLLRALNEIVSLGEVEGVGADIRLKYVLAALHNIKGLLAASSNHADKIYVLESGSVEQNLEGTLARVTQVRNEIYEVLRAWGE